MIFLLTVNSLLAPLTIKGTGRLEEDVMFKDDVFVADLPTKGIYPLNTHRFMPASCAGVGRISVLIL
jgi:hypothetical protein